MKNFLIFTILIFFLLSCQSVTNRIDENVNKEETKLSKWLNKSEYELKIEFGKPDEIYFKDNSPNRFYKYTKEKLKIKCQRIFEINEKNLIIGYTSKNCF